MKKDSHITEVVFRKMDDEIIAIFPEIKADQRGNLMSYMHVGQYGGASPEIITDNPVAIGSEYKSLWDELSGIGYNLKLSKLHNQARATKEAKVSSTALNQQTKDRK